MKNLTDKEMATLKEKLFEHLGSENLQTWATAAQHLITLEQLSVQEYQSEALQYMKKAMETMEKASDEEEK
ncbi:MAG TPA: hypothetical protein ENH82_00870 [bacterium]|nr:hypothetical protein [bacterium]